MDDMTWKAAMSSEVFRIYAENEANSLRQQKLAMEQVAETTDEDVKALEEFEQFERDIKASPTKLKVFQALQEKFASDPEYTATVKKSFVDSIMLLNLD